MLDDARREAHAAAACDRIAGRELEVDVKSQFAECLIARRSFACDV